MARSKKLQKKLDDKWWYKLGNIILWFFVIGGFFVSANDGLVFGFLGALINFVVILGLGKLILHLILSADKNLSNK